MDPVAIIALSLSAATAIFTGLTYRHRSTSAKRSLRAELVIVDLDALAEESPSRDGNDILTAIVLNNGEHEATQVALAQRLNGKVIYAGGALRDEPSRTIHSGDLEEFVFSLPPGTAAESVDDRSHGFPPENHIFLATYIDGVGLHVKALLGSLNQQSLAVLAGVAPVAPVAAALATISLPKRRTRAAPPAAAREPERDLAGVVSR